MPDGKMISGFPIVSAYNLFPRRVVTYGNLTFFLDSKMMTFNKMSAKGYIRRVQLLFRDELCRARFEYPFENARMVMANRTQNRTLRNTLCDKLGCSHLCTERIKLESKNWQIFGTEKRMLQLVISGFLMIRRNGKSRRIYFL